MPSALPLLVLVAVLVGLFLAARRPSGISLEVQAESLLVRVTGTDGVLALRRTIRLPLASIQGVAVAPRRLVPATGLRLPGTGIPGVLRAGSFGSGSTRDFWLVRRAEQVLVIELKPGSTYRRLVLEVPDPQAEALRLRPILGPLDINFADR